MDSETQVPFEVIIAGYGVPGRTVADLLRRQAVPHCVIELNPATVERCAKYGTHIISGDCREASVLTAAGIQHARMLIIAVPDEKVGLEATIQARAINPHIRIITRCHYTSTGIEIRSRGADEVIVAEQIVAEEFIRRLETAAAHFPTGR